MQYLQNKGAILYRITILFYFHQIGTLMHASHPHSETGLCQIEYWLVHIMSALVSSSESFGKTGNIPSAYPNAIAKPRDGQPHHAFVAGMDEP